MDVRRAGFVLGRPAVLLVVLPGATRVRLRAEAEVRRRGWAVAESPAAASVVLVAGEAEGHEGLLGSVWSQVPHPKAWGVVAEPSRVGAELDAAAERLRGGTGSGSPGWPVPGVDAHLAGAGHGAHAAHSGHDHHHGGVIAGLPLADRADDRDGLRLDRLHLPIGPVLVDWPAGLVLDLALQGDVIRRAHVRSPAAGVRTSYWDEPWLRAARGEAVTRGEAERRRCAAHLDSSARLLGVAGWPDAAARARALRDAVLAGDGIAEPAGWSRRVARSRTLRHLTRGLGVLPAGRARRLGITGPAYDADGDVHARLLGWLDEAVRAAAGRDDPEPLPADDRRGPRGRLDDPDRPPSQALLDALPELLEGVEFAAGRLIVASLDPDLDGLGPPRPAHHGPHAHGGGHD